MLPPLLTARPGPQTLLIAVATIMLACGPVALPIPDAGDTLPAAQQEGGDSVGESGVETPTEIPPPPPKPTFTYPNIGDSGLHFDVVEFEEAQKSASGPSGQSDAAPEDTVVLVRILLSSNKAEVAAWLRSRGITPIYAESPDIANLAAEVPLSLLGELSRQDGVREIKQPPQFKPGSW